MGTPSGNSGSPRRVITSTQRLEYPGSRVGWPGKSGGSCGPQRNPTGLRLDGRWRCQSSGRPSIRHHHLRGPPYCTASRPPSGPRLGDRERYVVGGYYLLVVKTSATAAAAAASKVIRRAVGAQPARTARPISVISRPRGPSPFSTAASFGQHAADSCRLHLLQSPLSNARSGGQNGRSAAFKTARDSKRQQETARDNCVPTKAGEKAGQKHERPRS
jgi:hypothetical protein